MSNSRLLKFVDDGSVSMIPRPQKSPHSVAQLNSSLCLIDAVEAYATTVHEVSGSIP